MYITRFRISFFVNAIYHLSIHGIHVSQFQNLSEVTGFVLSILFILDVLTITLICIIYIMQSRSGMLQNSMYLLTSPVGAAIISVGFIYSLFIKKGENRVARKRISS